MTKMVVTLERLEDFFASFPPKNWIFILSSIQVSGKKTSMN